LSASALPNCPQSTTDISQIALAIYSVTLKNLLKPSGCGIIVDMETEISHTNPSLSSARYPVTQEQIDDILKNELRSLEFPVWPVYNSRIRANGITKGEVYPWGQLKKIISIEIGRQDRPDRRFLTDTLLHEYFEAEIMAKQFKDEFYRSLSKAGDGKRHEWINKEIAEFLNSLEE